jgi:pimeloyl-ACP methyl ester carboxylesterase
MMKGKRVLFFVSVSLLCLVPAFAADISGKWRAQIDTSIGVMNYAYEFQVDGEKLTGRAESAETLPPTQSLPKAAGGGGGAPEPATISGKLADGTSYSVSKPENWNGELILDLDGAIPARGFTRWLLDHGYAQGGTNRTVCGYNFPQCVDNLVEVRRLFAERFGPPKQTIAAGGSRGAFVARLALERYPKLFDAAMSSAGGGAGSLATFNSKLDAVWALKTLVNLKSSLRLVNITSVEDENSALSALLKEAMATPQGRARLSLAAAFEQFALWADPKAPEPAETDYDSQLDQIASQFVFANPPVVRVGMEKAAGGNIGWNNGVDYRRLLELSGRKEMVMALYRKANLDLDLDLTILDRTERISADPTALGRAEPLMSYTGKIAGPIIVVDNDDPVDAAPLKLAYVETLKKAGTADLLRLCWVHGAGHGGQTDIERVAGFVTLINRLETGKWGDTSPAAMNALAEKLAKETSLQLGTPRFFGYQPPMPLRTWDASNWGTYSPATAGTRAGSPIQ